MSVVAERAALREVMGELVTGVCVVSTLVHGRPGRPADAIVVNSFTSVSLRPPLVSMWLREDSTFLGHVLRSGVWAVSILAEDGAPLARELTVASEHRPPLDELDHIARWVPGPRTGCPTLAGSPGRIECEQHRHVPLGDHVLVVGRVVGLDRQPGRPLLFHRGGYGALPADDPEFCGVHNFPGGNP
ncbi:flavin reductase [Longimycelium tulufanense]|uniref:Flavin reductase n=1 Tax=Longimycelium tulufanense TaxID=907463 RepID=A0A8J3C805_9PSEU|nr:flavin reductase family protein [Longimycelium tulufanense]GGM52953.1 flavin reductase [Longimycelium tulufanense]